jgi:hypothetical protein
MEVAVNDPQRLGSLIAGQLPDERVLALGVRTPDGHVVGLHPRREKQPSPLDPRVGKPAPAPVAYDPPTTLWYELTTPIDTPLTLMVRSNRVLLTDESGRAVNTSGDQGVYRFPATVARQTIRLNIVGQR